ncbi:MAG: YceI family protein, partial [bacterium]|nr:YceI family protein [bacterium]
RSTAKLEFIHGQTDQIAGWVSFDVESPRSGVSAVLRVDLASLKTGIETRDEHMREKHLHTDKFPHAWFSLDSVGGLPTRMVADSQYSGVAYGEFYIHGVKRPLQADLVFGHFQESGGEAAVEVHATFEIKLDDFKIERPRALFLKLAETIELEVSFLAFEKELKERLQPSDWQTVD